MKITIHRGARQIGGSCIEVATAGTRLILDAGLPLDAPLASGASRGCRPRPDIHVPGLFGPGSRVDAVLLTHAHPDHSGLLASRCDGIPAFMTGATSRVMTSLGIFANGAWLKDQHTLREHEPTLIGDCTVTALPVDHSIAGACAFLIEAEGKRILYSGDLRLHGRKPGMIKRLVAAARERPLDLLLIEGTRLRPAVSPTPSGRHLLSEQDVEAQLVELISGAKGLVLACFGPTNLDRLVSFFRAAIKTDRFLALDAYASHVLYMLKGIGRGGLPDPEKVGRIRLLSGTGRVPAKAGAGTRSFLERMRIKTVPLEELYGNPQRFIAIARPTSLKRDFPRGLPPKTLAIYSMWFGYREREEWRDFTTAVETAGGSVEECHASGHIHPEDLGRLIHDLEPRLLVPVHTEIPEMFRQLWPKLHVAEDGVPFDI